MNIVLLGFGHPILQLIDCADKSSLQILGIEQDFRRDGADQEAFEKEARRRRVPVYDDITKISRKIDLAVVINYNKIIDLKRFHPKTLLLNIHMGLLPKYRGNGANAWAILNGEKYVGYTVHKITDNLDSGPIYYQFRHNINKDHSYEPAKKAINEDINEHFWDIVKKIHQKTIHARSQNNKRFVYCTKLRSSDGIVSSWDIDTEYLTRLYMVFSRPLGTGLKFMVKNNMFEVLDLSKIAFFTKSIGVPGAVVNIHYNSVWVKTKDTAISLDKISLNGNVIDPRQYFKIGMRL